MQWSTPTKYPPDVLAASRITCFSSSFKIYGFVVAPKCTLLLNSSLFVILFAAPKIRLLTTKLLTSKSISNHSCNKSAASYFQSDSHTEIKDSILSTFATPIPCVPVRVFIIAGNFPPICLWASSILFLLLTIDVLGIATL